jgi:hypothetical protein
MKWLFIGFIIIQITVDLAHSVTVFPFVHYGMFSESFARPDSLLVYEVTVDGRRLEAADYRVYRWDMIQSPLTAFDKMVTSNDFSFDREQLRTHLSGAGAGALYRLMAPGLENDSLTASLFPTWYKAHLTRLLGHPIGLLKVDKAWYRYENGHWQLLKLDNRITI